MLLERLRVADEKVFTEIGPDLSATWDDWSLDARWGNIYILDKLYEYIDN